MKGLTRYMLVAVAATFLVGCSVRIGDFTVMSSKNFQTGQKYKKVGRFTGEDRTFALLGIPFGMPNLKTAVDRAIEAGKGVYLADVVLESREGLFDIGYVVTGDVFAAASMGDLSNPNVELFSFSIEDGRQVLRSNQHIVELTPSVSE